MKNNNNNNNKRHNIKNHKKNYRRKPNHRKFNIANYNTRTRPSTFGPGMYFLSVTKLVSGSLNTEVAIRVSDDVLANNIEFERVKGDFKYMKLQGLVVTFFPRNMPIQANQKPAYMAINYDGELTKNIRLQDSTKIIPAFMSRAKKFKFNIPRISVYSSVLCDWLSIYDGTLAYNGIIIQIHAPGNNTDWDFKVDTIITLRGPTYADESKILDMTKIRENAVNCTMSKPIIKADGSKDKSISEEELATF